MRGHKRGQRCKERREFLKMQAQDYRVFSLYNTDHLLHLVRAPEVQAIIVKGKYGQYLPRTVLVYSEYIYQVHREKWVGSPSLPVDERLAMLIAFIKLTPEQQQGHLDGIQLAYEVYREEHQQDFDDAEIPF